MSKISVEHLPVNLDWITDTNIVPLSILSCLTNPIDELRLEMRVKEQ